MEYQKLLNLLDTASDNDLTRFATKNGLKLMTNQEEIPVLTRNKN